MLFRELSAVEDAQFRDYASKNDPPNLADWDIYHPVCREVWTARGITPHNPTLPTLSTVREIENPTPTFDAPVQTLVLTSEQVEPRTRSLWDAGSDVPAHGCSED